MPSNGLFVDHLISFCEENDFEFFHVVLYAPRDILERRKLLRDGNSDLGPVDIRKIRMLNKTMIFDTSKSSLQTINDRMMSALNL